MGTSHGIQWLENQGNLRFVYHRLTDLIGVYRTRVADLDLDGDPDSAVGAMRPDFTEPMADWLAIWWNQAVPDIASP